MIEFMNSLNSSSGAWTVIFSGVVTGATVVYAILTWRLVKETRLLREVQTEPAIEIFLKPLEIALHFVRLHIKNVGLGPAFEIKFSITATEGGDSAKGLIRDFTKTKFLTHGLKYLGSGQERISGYTQMTEDYEGKIASNLVIEISYKSALGKKYHESLTVDMSEHEGTYQLGTPHLYSIAESLKKIEKTTRDIATGFRRPKVDIYTAENRATEREEMEKHRQEFADKIESEKTKGAGDT